MVRVGVAALLNRARPAASPNPVGITTATVRVPARTPARAASRGGVVTRSVLSPVAPATTARETALPSSSTMAMGIFADSDVFWPVKIDPKKDAMAIGATKPMITARRSLKNSSRSLRTSARNATHCINRGGSVRSGRETLAPG